MVLWCMLNKLALSLSFIVVMGMLSACSPKGMLHLNSGESTQSKNQNIAAKSTNNGSIGAPVALPPKFSTPGQNTPQNLVKLSPMKGINVDTMFSENIKDTGDRFNRVENAVKDLRKEFDGYKPSIVRLAAVESDIQNLIKELEVLLQETPTPQQPTSLTTGLENAQLQVTQLDEEQTPPSQSSMPASPKQSPPEEKVISKKSKPRPPPPPSKVNHTGSVAQNLRVGEHADKLRIAIDTNKNFKYSIDIDNEEKLIIVEIPEAKWVGKENVKFNDSPLLDSYTIESINDNKGTMVIISLKKATSILTQDNLSPDNTSPYHRIYFDLKL